jgi:hypothetical protein
LDDALNPNDEHNTYPYDAFISYSRKDEAFAKRLEADLERYRPPRGITPHKRRLNIFRDVRDLVGNELSNAIKDALLELKGHQSKVRYAAWNRSGKKIVSLGDRTARVWDTATGTQIQAFEKYRSAIQQLAWNSQGTQLATVSERQLIIQYTDLDELLLAACKKVKKNMRGIDWERFFPGEGYRRTCPELPPPEKFDLDGFLERKKP